MKTLKIFLLVLLFMAALYARPINRRTNLARESLNRAIKAMGGIDALLAVDICQSGFIRHPIGNSKYHLRYSYAAHCVGWCSHRIAEPTRYRGTVTIDLCQANASSIESRPAQRDRMWEERIKHSK